MFTLEIIENLHSKVKSGADFPLYIKDLKNIGVISYEVFVIDGHSKYIGKDGFILISKPIYNELEINSFVNKDVFIERLKIHQNGGSDYITFCRDAGKSGISKWIMDLEQFTCSYIDFAGNVVLVEKVPCVD